MPVRPSVSLPSLSSSPQYHAPINPIFLSSKTSQKKPRGRVSELPTSRSVDKPLHVVGTSPFMLAMLNSLVSVCIETAAHHGVPDKTEGHHVRAGSESHRGVFCPVPVEVAARLRQVRVQHDHLLTKSCSELVGEGDTIDWWVGRVHRHILPHPAITESYYPFFTGTIRFTSCKEMSTTLGSFCVRRVSHLLVPLPEFGAL